MLRNSIPKFAPWFLLVVIALLWLGRINGDIRYYFPAILIATLVMRNWFAKRLTWPAIVIGSALALSCWLLAPDLSDDYHRYLWEGHVQNQGYSPYQHSPQALYDIFEHPSETLINNDHLPAIYPPLAQYLFRLGDLFSNSVWGWKLILLLWCVFWSFFLRKWSWQVLAFTPIVLFEGWWNAHLDLAGLMPCLVLLDAAETEKPVKAGLCMGVLIALKTMPLIWFPFLFFHFKSKDRIKFLGVSLLLVILFYLPYLDQGTALFHSFLTFSKTWSFNNLLYISLSEIFEASLARNLLALLFLFGYGLVLLRTKDFNRQCLLAWILLILCSPTFFPWYLLWLLPFVKPNRSTIFNTTYLVAFISYWVLLDYRNSGLWHEQWYWLIPEWILLGICFVAMIKPQPSSQGDAHTQSSPAHELDAP